MVKWRRFTSVGGALVIMLALYHLMNARTFQLGGVLVPRVATSDKVIALTFDHGSKPVFTEQILAILKDVNIKATFFVTGADLEQHMTTGQQLVAAGQCTEQRVAADANNAFP